MSLFRAPRGRVVRAVGAAVLFATAAGLPVARAHADLQDVSVGGDARVFAMGGAGIALSYGGGQRINPASIALESKSFDATLPSVGLRTNGISSGDVENAAKNGDAGSAGALLRDFGSKDSGVGVNADFSVRVSKFEFGVNGAAQGFLYPNSDLQTLTGLNGTTYSSVPAKYAYLNPRADVIEGGYYAYTAATGFYVTPNTVDASRSAIGIRLKDMRGEYAHYYANADVLEDGGSALPASEMDGKTTPLTKNGFGADVGCVTHPYKGQGISYGVIVNNLVNPGFSFNGTDQNGAAKNYKLLATTFSGGIGVNDANTSYAVDLVDLTSASEKREIRVGGEQRYSSSGLAIRAGYASNSGFTYGASLAGFGFALGRHLPLEVSQNLKF